MLYVKVVDANDNLLSLVDCRRSRSEMSFGMLFTLTIETYYVPIVNKWIEAHIEVVPRYEPQSTC